MTIPYITNKQQEIPKLLYKFRFLNRLQIQKLLNHKYHKRINDWLNDLAKKEYVVKLPKANSFDERTKLTVYRIGINGIRFLKTQEGYSLGLIRQLYREKDRSDNFINQCILLADICLNLRDQDNASLSYEITTASDFANDDSPFHFLTELNPHLVILEQENRNKKTTNKYYILEAFEPTLPRHSIRKRIRTYLEFYYRNQWENSIGKPFPTIKLICPKKADLIYAKRFAKKLLKEEQWPKNLHIEFTEASEVREIGVTGGIWEEVK